MSNDAISRRELLSCPEIMEYIEMVEHPEPEYPVCLEQTLLVNMIRAIFDAEELYVEKAKLQKYLNLQKYLPFSLFPWEKALFALHNCVRTAEGRLRWPELLGYMGRGGGKNGYLTFEDFALISPVNGIQKYNIDIFANAEDQARTSFDDVWNIMEANERKLGRFFEWNRERILCKSTGSVFRFRTSNAKTKDGGRPGKVDFDEYHAYENYDIVRVAKTGLGKVMDPRTTIISTDGDVRDGPLDHLLSRSRQILTGVIPDNGLLPFICKLDKKEEVADEKNWHKANPSLRYFPTLLDTMRREYADYVLDNIGNAAFMTKRMNIPQGNLESEVTSWENIKACSRAPKSLPTVWVAGIDFAKTTDFVGALIFGINAEGEWVWQQHTWVCSACKDLSRIKFPVQDAVEKGYITWVEDVEISGEYPAKWIEEQKRTKNIVAVAVDDYRFGIIKAELQRAGFVAGKDGNVKMVKGRDIMQIAPMLIAKFARQEIAFGDDPVMRWNINNTKQALDSRGNITFGKIEPKTRKTDTFMAGVAAVTLIEKLEAEMSMQSLPMDVMIF